MSTLIGTPIKEVIDRFKVQEKNVEYVPFSTVKIENDDIVFGLGGKEVHNSKVTNRYWLKYFCDLARIPYRYIETLTPELQTELVNFHVPSIPNSRFTGNGTKTLIKDKSDNSFGVVSKFRQYMPPSELLEMYESFFDGTTNVVHYDVALDAPRFSILNDKWDMSFLTKRDISYFGLSVNWSHNSSVPQVFGSSHRPSCANLLCVPRNIGRINLQLKNATRASVVSRFSTAGKKAISHVNRILIPQLTGSTQKTFSDLTEFLDQIKVSKNTRELILRAFLQEEGNTVYHVIQACTYATTHFDLNEKEIKSLNKVVEFLLDASDVAHTSCQLCHRQI